MDLFILLNAHLHFTMRQFNTLRGLPEKIVDGKARQWTDAEAAQQDDWRQGMIEEYLKDKNRTCLIQVWQEALFPDRAPHFPELKRRDANTLTAIICNKMGWVRGNAENFDGYGKQKSYHKEPPKIDFEPL